MVFYFTSAVVTPPYTIYMGKDKYENEDLIKYGWPEDIWGRFNAFKNKDGVKWKKDFERIRKGRLTL